MSRRISLDDVTMHRSPSYDETKLTVGHIIDWEDGLAPCAEGSRLRITTQTYEPGGRHGAHQHDTMEQAYLIVSGTGRVTLGDEVFDAEPGMYFFVPPNVDHNIENTGDAELVHLIVNVKLD